MIDINVDKFKGENCDRTKMIGKMIDKNMTRHCIGHFGACTDMYWALWHLTFLPKFTGIEMFLPITATLTYY